MQRILIFFILFTPEILHAQDVINNPYQIIHTDQTEYYNAIWYIYGNDTIVNATMATIVITADGKNRAATRQYDKLQRRVIKTYPYARAAADVMDMYEKICTVVTDEKEKERLLDVAEEEMKRNFEKDLRKLTVSEGVILIKLIDRETGKNSFEVVRALKGRFSAFMWQSLARIFGHNLKSEYDATGEDLQIENIVREIEDGFIPVERRYVNPFPGYTFQPSK
jgi:hypothetical protein